MRKLITLSIFLIFNSIFLIFSSFAQAPPEGINYQAVARNTAGTALANATLDVQFIIHDVTAGGTVVYTETHTGIVTNMYGLFTIVIGGVTPVAFSNINWGSGNKFLEVKVDDGSGYVSMGSTQMMSVPYALYAKNAGSGTNGKNSLILTTIENAGANCANGGFKTEYGLDANGNNVLDASEINGTLTRYVCNGLAGTTGTNGTNGQTSLVKTTPESAGANCAIGGFKTEYGLDANSNNTLDISEINGTLTRYVCNGAAGTNGISINWLGSFSTIPSTPSLNQAYYNTTDKKSYVYNGSAWQILAQDGTNGLNILYGSTNPANTLGVNGEFYINIASNTLFGPKASGTWPGTGVSLVGPPGSLPPGATAGNTPYWNGTTWIVNNSNIFNNGGNVGIGVSSPSVKLDVAGGSIRATDANSTSLTAFSNALSSNSFLSLVAQNSSTQREWRVINNGGTGGNLEFRDATQSLNRMTIDVNGNVGIGTNTPVATLDVLGKVKIADGTQGLGKVFTSDVNGAGSWQVAPGSGSPWTKNGAAIYPTTISDSVGIGTNTPKSILHLYGKTDPLEIIIENTGGAFKTGLHIKTATHEWMVGQAGSTDFKIVDLTAAQPRLIIDPTGNVGIGTITPGAKLDVQGKVKIVDGNEGAGKVFTSDAAGIGSWQTPPGGGPAWILGGNAGTNSVSDFVGTTDAQDLVLKVNSIEKIRLGDNNTSIFSAGQFVMKTSTNTNPAFTILGGTAFQSTNLNIQKNVAVSAPGMIGALTFSDAGNSFNQAMIVGQRDAAGGTPTDLPTALVFYTTPDNTGGAGTEVERMRISNTGSVSIGAGIGTKNKLTVKGSVAVSRVTAATTYSITPNDYIIEFSGLGTAILPASATVDEGTMLILRNRSNATITVNLAPGDFLQLPGASTDLTTTTITSFQSLRLYLSGQRWIAW